MPHLTLIYPAMGRKPGEPFVRSWQMQPLAIARLAAMTPAHWQIAFMDDRIEPINYDLPTDLVGISIEAYTAKRAYQIAAEFRRRGVPVILGGYQATLCPDEVQQHADSVCIGEAEGVWQDILSHAEQGRLRPSYQGELSKELRGVQADRRIFDGKNYLPLALVETSRGCPFRCGFCSIAAMYRGTYRRRPAQEIVDELRGIPEKHVFFVDDNLLGDLESAREFLEAIEPLRIRWISQTSLHALNDETLVHQLADSGCLALLIGFESLNAQNLESMGKKVNRTDQYGKTLGLLRRAGIGVYGTFMFGYPYDTPSLFEKSVRFAKDQKMLLAAFNHLVPFPGTALYDEVKSEGRLIYDRWWLSDDYRFGQIPFHPAAMTAAEIENRCNRARTEFYSVRSMLRRGLDFQCNSLDLRHALVYWKLNLLLRKEVLQKRGIPLAGCAAPVPGK